MARILHCAPFNLFTKNGGALYLNPIKFSLGLVKNDNFVHNFDYRDTARYFSFFKNKNSGKDKMNRYFKEVIENIRPDIVIFGHAELINLNIFEFLKDKKIKTIFWYNDVEYHENFVNIAKNVDLVFSTSTNVSNFFKSYNKNSFFIPNPVDSSVEKYYGYENDNYQFDIFFPGRIVSNRQNFIEYINSNFKDKKIKIIGTNKDNVVMGDKYFSLIINSKICLNNNRNENNPDRYYSSDRLVHMLGNGAFTISSEILGIEKFYEDKLVCFYNLDDLKEKILYFLNSDNDRREKAKWLRNRTHELFNSKKVASYMIDVLYENSSLEKYEWWD